MSLFFDNNYDHGNNNRMSVHASEQVNAEQMPKRGFFINVQPVARTNYQDDGSSKEQWQQLTHRGNNLNISPGEVKRESFTKTTSMKRVRIEE